MPIDRLFRLPALAVMTMGALVLSACAGQPAPADEGGVTARIVTVGTPGSNVGFLFDDIPDAVEAVGGSAEDAGYFPNTEPALEALNGGAADFATIVTSGAVTGLTGSGDYLLLGVSKRDPGQLSSIVVPVDSDIQSVEDLAGRSVAVTKGAAGEYIVDQAVTNHDMAADAVEKVYLGPGDAAGAFTQGSIDAWAAFYTFIPAALSNMGARILITGDDELKGKLDYAVLVVRRDFAEANPEVTAAVLRGYTAGAEKVLESPDEFFAIQKSANDFSEEQLDYLLETLPVYEPYDEETRASLQETIDSWHAIGTLTKAFDVADIVFDVPAANP
ncbi:ABC transporter substrate-binding protein [Microbacterium sp. LWS13-1.2]|uniref:ABC transporter substrate-binding protein n=1 Tax=Microbacterium sp. LWS13-1.2 TaxID=3135264 RepID=A0AAU6SBQ0_9MICO